MAIFIKQDNQLVKSQNLEYSIINEPNSYVGFVESATSTASYSRHTAIANTKYYISNIGSNQFSFKNKLWLIALPTSFSNIDISDCIDYREIKQNQSVTGILVWGFPWNNAFTETSSSMTIGVDSTGPYFLFPQNTQIGCCERSSWSSSKNACLSFMIKLNDKYYTIFVENIGTIINNNKSSIAAYTGSYAYSAPRRYFNSYSYEGFFTRDITKLRDSIVESYKKDKSVNPKGAWINTVLNNKGNWYNLSSVYIYITESRVLYFTFISGRRCITLPRGVNFKL